MSAGTRCHKQRPIFRKVPHARAYGKFTGNTLYRVTPCATSGSRVLLAPTRTGRRHPEKSLVSEDS